MANTDSEQVLWKKVKSKHAQLLGNVVRTNEIGFKNLQFLLKMSLLHYGLTS